MVGYGRCRHGVQTRLRARLSIVHATKLPRSIVRQAVCAFGDATGHGSVQMVRRYIREGNLVRENSAGKLGV